MTQTVRKEAFNDTAHGMRILKTMQRASEVGIFWGDPVEGKIKSAPSHKGIYNETTGEFVKPVSDSYLLIEHEEAFSHIIQSLSSIGMKMNGEIIEMDNKAWMNIHFPDIKIEDDASGIYPGFCVYNSYNGSSGFGGYMGALRGVCSNGMILRHIVPETSFSIKHVGEKVKVAQNTDEWIKNMIESHKELKDYINSAIHDSVEWDMTVKFLENFKSIPKKHREGIKNILIDTADGKSKITRWDIYNAFTQWATHGNRISMQTAEFLQQKAENILENPMIKLVEN